MLFRFKYPHSEDLAITIKYTDQGTIDDSLDAAGALSFVQDNSHFCLCNEEAYYDEDEMPCESLCFEEVLSISCKQILQRAVLMELRL